MSESKQAPREFDIFLHDNGVSGWITGREIGKEKQRYINEKIHLVEYKAYEAEKQKVLELVRFIKTLKAQDKFNFQDEFWANELINKYGGSDE